MDRHPLNGVGGRPVQVAQPTTHTGRWSAEPQPTLQVSSSRNGRGVHPEPFADARGQPGNFPLPMNLYASWHGTRHPYWSDYTWQRLGGGQRAAGDCRTVIERLREMACQADTAALVGDDPSGPGVAPARPGRLPPALQRRPAAAPDRRSRHRDAAQRRRSARPAPGAPGPARRRHHRRTHDRAPGLVPAPRRRADRHPHRRRDRPDHRRAARPHRPPAVERLPTIRYLRARHVSPTDAASGAAVRGDSAHVRRSRRRPPARLMHDTTAKCRTCVRKRGYTIIQDPRLIGAAYVRRAAREIRSWAYPTRLIGVHEPGCRCGKR
ncbi:MAG: hypothetical protein QOE51_184 [Actinoplanes sp.]|nr:hypothetical protein [Actinoplanes sp.]